MKRRILAALAAVAILGTLGGAVLLGQSVGDGLAAYLEHPVMTP